MCPHCRRAPLPRNRLLEKGDAGGDTRRPECVKGISNVRIAESRREGVGGDKIQRGKGYGLQPGGVMYGAGEVKRRGRGLVDVGYQERKRLRPSQEYGPVSGAAGWGGGKGGRECVCSWRNRIREKAANAIEGFEPGFFKISDGARGELDSVWEERSAYSCEMTDTDKTITNMVA